MEREEFKKNAKKNIDAIFNKIDELETKEQKLEEHIKTEYNERLSDLKAMKNELQGHYDELVDATDKTWEKVKNTFSSTAESFEQGLSEIANLK